MRRKREPAPRENSHGESGLGEVEVTIDVVRRPDGSRPRARRSRSAILALALALGVAGGLFVVSSGPGSSPLTSASARGAQAARPRGSVSRFGIRSHCVRRAIVSRHGGFARVDFDRGAMCGAAGNHVTLILRRVRHAWVAAFDATGWRCPAAALPRPVLRELRLCRGRGPALAPLRFRDGARGSGARGTERNAPTPRTHLR